MSVYDKAGTVVDGVIRAIGFSPAAFTLTEQDRTVFTDAANEALRIAWARQLWPLLMRVEPRRYRPTWSAATPYVAGNEVWHGTAYWICLKPDTGTEPGGDATVWGIPTTFMPFIQLEQPWETWAIDDHGFDLAAFAWEDDPRLNPGVPPISGCDVWMDSIVLPQSAPDQVWIRFMPRCPVLDFTEWSVSEVYAAADVRYHTATGKCWAAVRANTGVTPGSSADDWSEVGVPRFMVPYIRHYILAAWRTEDAGRYQSEGAAERALQLMERDAFERAGVARGARWGGFKRRS